MPAEVPLLLGILGLLGLLGLEGCPVAAGSGLGAPSEPFLHEPSDVGANCMKKKKARPSSIFA